jgi:hypothetical protein
MLQAGNAKSPREENSRNLTWWAKILVLAIFVSAFGVVLGLVGIFADWPLGKTIGLVSIFILFAILQFGEVLVRSDADVWKE